MGGRYCERQFEEKACNLGECKADECHGLFLNLGWEDPKVVMRTGQLNKSPWAAVTKPVGNGVPGWELLNRLGVVPAKIPLLNNLCAGSNQISQALRVLVKSMVDRAVVSIMSDPESRAKVEAMTSDERVFMAARAEDILKEAESAIITQVDATVMKLKALFETDQPAK